MRFLFVSNLFPPFARGGYEQWCQEVATELVSRGHSVCVLTSLQPLDAVSPAPKLSFPVHRVLYPEVRGGLGRTALRLLVSRRWRESQNVRETNKVISAFQPDVALIWGMWNMPRSVAAHIETTLRDCVAYYLCDYWLALPNAYIQRWQEPATHRGATALKRLVGRPFLARLNREVTTPLALTNPICVSRAVRDKLVKDGVPVRHARIIYGGIQIEQFDGTLDGQGDHPETLRLVFVGRLEPEKGLPTALEALRICQRNQQTKISLTICGQGEDSYVTYLKTLTQDYGLEKSVTFLGMVPHSKIPDVLRNHDALVFPSIWEEPFARTVIEALAAGAAVIGTTTGGTPELLTHMVTGLTFPPGDASALADQISRIHSNPELGRLLAQNGQAYVRRYFTFDRMVDELEQTLLTLGSQVGFPSHADRQG